MKYRQSVECFIFVRPIKILLHPILYSSEAEYQAKWFLATKHSSSIVYERQGIVSLGQGIWVKPWHVVRVKRSALTYAMLCFLKGL